MIERMMTLLEKEKTKEALTRYWSNVEMWANAIQNDEVESWNAETWEEAIEMALDHVGYPDRAAWIMWTEVLEKCDPPHIITAEELTDALFSLLPGETISTEEVINEAYPAFLSRVRSLLRYRGSRSFAITELPLMAPDDLAVVAERSDEIWSGSGVSVNVSGTGCSDIDAEIGAHDIFLRRHLLYARIWGRISSVALKTLADELKGVIRSLIRSATAASCETRLRILPVFPTILPYAGIEPVADEASFLRMCLDSYFAKPSSKKDSLERRIHNAIALLVEADTQATDAVGIALAVTAIEALLGVRGAEMTAALSDRVATLLEPDPQHRDLANAFTKKVYDDRSRVLHGESLDAERERRDEIRCLAAGVLYAVTNYVDCLRRGGFEPQTPDEMLNELRKGKYVPGQPFGVPELPRVRELWRGRGSRPKAL